MVQLHVAPSVASSFQLLRCDCGRAAAGHTGSAQQQHCRGPDWVGPCVLALFCHKAASAASALGAGDHILCANPSCRLFHPPLCPPSMFPVHRADFGTHCCAWTQCAHLCTCTSPAVPLTAALASGMPMASPTAGPPRRSPHSQVADLSKHEPVTQYTGHGSPKLSFSVVWEGQFDRHSLRTSFQGSGFRAKAKKL